MAPNQIVTRDARGSKPACAQENGINFLGRLNALFHKSWAHKLLPTAMALAATLAVLVTFKVIGNLGPSGNDRTTFQAAAGTGSGLTRPLIEEDISGSRQWVVSHRTGLYVIMAAILASFGVILVLFISRIVVPLNAITAVVRSMADGDLTVSAPETLPYDMRPLGQGLNDLAANFQEVLLFTGATTGNLRNELEALEARLSRQDAHVDTDELKMNISELRLEVETLSAMVEQFKYYQADFNGKEVKPR